MTDRPTKENRDANRQNMATSIVQATMYSNLVEDGLKCITDMTKTVIETNSDLSENSKRKFESILRLTEDCLKTNTAATAKYQKCSTYIKRGSVNIAKRESTLIKNALSNKEDPSLIQTLHHFEPSMANIHANIYAHTPNSKCHPSQPLPVEEDHNSSVDNPSEHNVSTSYRLPTLPNTVAPTSQVTQATNTSTIPHPINPSGYHTPHEAIRILRAYTSKEKIFLPDFPADHKGSHWRKLSKHMIMKYMIDNYHVPIKATAFRKLSNTYDMYGKLPATTWTEITAKGRKPHLPYQKLNHIIGDIHQTTGGGQSINRTCIQQTVQSEIKNNWSVHHDVRYRYNTIPTSTMNRYMHKIMSHPSFNIQTAVSNKTESRSSAEWSVRSTISYLLVVLATHFIRAEPSSFHPKLASLDPLIAEVWKIVEEENDKTLSIHTINKCMEKLIPVLPQLVTSTDETTMFITSTIIKNKEVWYLYAKAVAERDILDSSKRDNYSTAMSGDAHCRGLRITMNNTFTAGGRVAPPFICVYGLSPDEMPGDEIVLVPIKGLVIGADQNGSMDEGYICFIRGKYDPKNGTEQDKENTNVSENDEDNDENTRPASVEPSPVDPPVSKEARVAKLYRETVYYPFIHNIRTKHYNMDENCPSEESEVPTNLTAVCWMDGCYGQLKLTTREDVLEKESKLKITCNKHSAARTAVEQAADVGPMFKLIKKLIRYMKQLRACQSPVYQRIVDALNECASPIDNNSEKIVRLETHKRKAIIAALSKLPSAMAAAFSPSIVISAFEDNGQIDRLDGVLPSIKGLIGTYRGSISNEHYLKGSEDIIRKFYNEVYTSGRISEKSFDNANVEVDVDSAGKEVNRSFGISKENCQRAKVLSAKTQRLERIELIKNMHKIEHNRKIELFNNEKKKYDSNKECEAKLLLTHNMLLRTQQTQQDIKTQDTVTTSLTFANILADLTEEHFGKDKREGNARGRPTIPQLSAFIQVRQPIAKFRGRCPQYKKMHKERSRIVTDCIRVCNIPPLHRIFEHPGDFEAQ